MRSSRSTSSEPLYKPGDPASLTAAVRELIENYSTYADGIRSATTDLNWEQDSAKLLAAYANLS